MSNDHSAAIVSKVWNYAHVLKNAGVGYGDYVEQITYLIFLKLADEMTELGFDNPIPDEFQWSELSSKSGDDLEVHYRHTLENLGTEPGLVGIIFRKAQNKISERSRQFFPDTVFSGRIPIFSYKIVFSRSGKLYKRRNIA